MRHQWLTRTTHSLSSKERFRGKIHFEMFWSDVVIRIVILWLFSVADDHISVGLRLTNRTARSISYIYSCSKYMGVRLGTTASSRWTWQKCKIYLEIIARAFVQTDKLELRLIWSIQCERKWERMKADAQCCHNLWPAGQNSRTEYATRSCAKMANIPMYNAAPWLRMNQKRACSVLLHEFSNIKKKSNKFPFQRSLSIRHCILISI